MQLENTEQPDRRELLSQQFDEVQNEAPVEAVRTQEQPNLEPPAEPPVWERPPASWKKDYHDVWPGVPDRAKEYFHTREDEIQNGINNARQAANEYEHIRKVMDPYMPTINGLGLDAPRAIKGLMEADHILRTSAPEHKRAYLLQLADHYGIQLGDVSQHAPTASAGNPDLYALKNELNQVRGEVVGWKKAQEDAANQTLLQDIANFAKGKTHFEEVRPAMASLLQAGLALDLEGAYTMAVRLNDELFASEQASIQGKQAAERRDTANRAAKAARGAAVSVRSSTPGVAAKTNAQDRRSMLAEQFDNMTDRL